MPAYLLTWNPKRFPWDTFLEDIASVDAGASQGFTWSCGNTRRICEGDEVFLARQGKEQPGLIGHGWITDPPFEDAHWPDETTAAKSAWYVGVRLDFLVEVPIVDRSQFKSPPFDRVHWASQASGVSIPDDAAAALRRAVADQLDTPTVLFGDEVEENLYSEGGARLLVVNAFERSAAAR